MDISRAQARSWETGAGGNVLLENKRIHETPGARMIKCLQKSATMPAGLQKCDVHLVVMVVIQLDTPPIVAHEENCIHSVNNGYP